MSYFYKNIHNMEFNIINTLKYGERVTSTYAEVYFHDDFCENNKAPAAKANSKLEAKTNNSENAATSKNEENLWVSPSDLLIGILELKPPFTSKITRGKTHEGILAIGGDIVATERAKFVAYLTKLIHENDAAWTHIYGHEKGSVAKKVKEVYRKIFMEKSAIMSREIDKFYEDTLQDLEKNLQLQVQEALVSLHASMIHTLNTEIKEKLAHEKQILQEELKNRYESELVKINKYYKLLLNNERRKCTQLISRAIVERNDVLRAFYREIEAENVTTTMYVMCTERKKCRIKQFMLKNCQTLELKEKYEKIKERQDILNVLKQQEQVSEINKNWEDKIKRIVKLFLKFISFSLKLLPEQTSFLLNFEKLVVLQLNEMQKMPYNVSSILVNTDTFENSFKFEDVGVQKEECVKEPFVLEGDSSDALKVQYGSRETLPNDEDLPTVRLQRQFVYAKCHHYEEIKAILEAQRCKCMDYQQQPQQMPKSGSSSSKHTAQEGHLSIKSESSIEPIFIDDFHRLNECPVRSCKDLTNRLPFPYLNPDTMVDFDDEKFEKVKAVLERLPKKDAMPSLVEAKDVVQKELPFSATKERYHTVETQYSSQEDLGSINVKCSCIDNYIPKSCASSPVVEESLNRTISENMAKRKISLRRLMQENHNLMKMFTDESFDFQF